MAKAAAVLGVHLLDAGRGAIRAGSLTRDTDGGVMFNVAETYLRDPLRPILSLGWLDPESEDRTRDRLASRSDKIGLHGSVPPWFDGLLPEGALRDLVLTEMGPGDHDQFDVLTRLGADLPGAVLIMPETEAPLSAGPLHLERVEGFQAVRPEGVVKFSLAGIQLKFTANPEGERLTLPGSGDSGRCIIKVASDRYAGLPEAEHGAMTLARMIGVDTAPCRLMPRSAVDGVPEELLAHGDNILVVDRFDRGAQGERIHIEDAGQIIGAVGDRTYTMANTDTVINMVNRFSSDRRADILEAVRRVVADILLGNGDNHLKNWSFRFPAPGEVRLSPAYDIIPTVLFIPHDRLALRFVRTHRFEAVDMHRFEHVARFLRVEPKWITREVRTTIERALDLWPKAAPEVLGERWAEALLARLDRLRLVQEARG
ncbi:type II toxin-antitoxin system HipA family toxin [Rhizorhabdus sp. FW153]|uniref:type II toxin-antitoxin system HipA family toxin n=1 Tax=Rhizorhabdus sp. FW153 TaxID=3400216 RepID=UPI003CF793E7